jgi:soluble lytic murein transglycosylase-like protein
MRARRLAHAVALLLVATAAHGCGDTDRRAAPAVTPSPTPAVPALPEADGALPRTPDALRAQLRDVDERLRAAIAAWRRNGDPRGRTPEDVELLALRQQRIYQRLAGRPVLAARVLRGVRGRLRAEARDVLGAMRAIAVLNAPHAKVRRTFRTQRALAPDVLRGFYAEARRRFRVGWPLLAAVHLVESGFGRMRNESVSGAQGPMQFMPATWRAYGLGGDVHDPRDAILGAANYLHASGAPADEARALYHYNPSSLYVRAVAAYARLMRRDAIAFYALHSWQVFVGTPEGRRRITGPGR